ncbi:transglycosylase domain-containing protein [Mitsuokella sp.]|uniref:transglycosylase domain-containing protein n=1 Tax=Mitsuokella TaxID=52225 RepID=UPI0029E577A8|nr:biosynthetic peptidoglycan transglycosylase [Mitsuokella sp.]MDD6381950.1 transglycosylase domain-containing protein [Selenomonadaceae bacterium]MDY4475103.1 biosynthetic peptidoglycan transglycosylase [Mitsuokella sp.]
MKKRRRRSPKRLARFLFLLLCVFLGAYFLSGGLAIFSSHTWQAAGDFLPRPDPQQPSNTLTADTEDTFRERLSRIVFLKRAVNSRIDRSHYTRLDEIPTSLQQAVVAVEDKRFYDHHGFDMEGILRATLVNLQQGEIDEGASTITQQLVKNLFLTHERSFGRKAEEFLLALSMEFNYSKDEILEMYLNTIYYGSSYYGIEEASEGYFGKRPRELQLPEAAMLAGLPNAPSLYSPYVDFMMAKKRQFIVLDAMVRAGYIDKTIAEDAKIKPIYLAH